MLHKAMRRDGKPRRFVIRAEVIAKLAQRFGLTTIVEVGVKQGQMTEMMVNLIPEAQIIAVDPWRVYADWPEWDQAKHDSNERAFDRVRHQYRDRIKKMKMTSLEAAKLMPDASLDLVFIDGDHSYPAVRADIDAWLPKVRPGGILSGHDYDNTDKYGNRFKGVDKAVEETFDKFHVEPDSVWWVQL